MKNDIRQEDIDYVTGVKQDGDDAIFASAEGLTVIRGDSGKVIFVEYGPDRGQERNARYMAKYYPHILAALA